MNEKARKYIEKRPAQKFNQMTFRVDESLIKEFDKACKHMGLNRSSGIRASMRMFIDEVFLGHVQARTKKGH